MNWLLLSTVFVIICSLRLSSALTCNGTWGIEGATFAACDGTCANPTPECLLTQTTHQRCGCLPGHVRNADNQCQYVHECDGNQVTQCEHESFINNEIRCDWRGFFEILQIIGGERKCVGWLDGVPFPPTHVVDDVIVDCANKLECDKVELNSEWTTRRCDGTCEDPAPPCIFEQQQEERCGCSIGHVVVTDFNHRYCKPVYQCDNRDDILTQCQLESLSIFQIQCNARGWFKKKQKIGQETKCVHPKTGRTIIAKRNSDRSFIDCKELSDCQLDFYKNEDHSFEYKEFMDHKWFECDEMDGDYTARQCWDHMPCKCVIPTTGSQIPIHGKTWVEKDFDCENAVLTRCQKEFVAKDLLNHRNNTKVELPNCWYYGYYNKIHCDDMDMCQCQHPFTGQRYPGRNINACGQLTACQAQYDDLDDDVDDDVEKKPCDDDGRFISKYCTDEICVCLDADSGNSIPDIQPLPITQQLICPDATPSSEEILYGHDSEEILYGYHY